MVPAALMQQNTQSCWRQFRFLGHSGLRDEGDEGFSGGTDSDGFKENVFHESADSGGPPAILASGGLFSGEI